MVYVALHACGSLTPSILRAILRGIKESVSRDKQNDGSAKCLHRATVCGAVVVGCCYNLMEGSGELICPFPISPFTTNACDLRHNILLFSLLVITDSRFFSQTSHYLRFSRSRMLSRCQLRTGTSLRRSRGRGFSLKMAN